ncbi:DUF2911 domain-containing protein [Eudoraea chungangensis]|uniref:DUF2911 domain-containing protein n=1 Tax=Eudoraea chungangensis TaxID=1481905 RepID=UPI0023EDE848|nr:DUF2911 domain-containing protein [Eudoraea chungangensis]
MKFLKWFLIVLGALALLFYFVAMPYLREETKKISPQKTAVYNKNGMDLQVSYSSPFKKGRVIFGELVPYDKVWRTGANEPTVLVNGSSVNIMGQELPAGTYSLWTIPGKEKWQVIFNKEVPGWGVTILSGGKETTRNPEEDLLQIELPAIKLIEEVESFTISFEETGALYLCLDWDKTKIRIPITK